MLCSLFILVVLCATINAVRVMPKFFFMLFCYIEILSVQQHPLRICESLCRVICFTVQAIVRNLNVRVFLCPLNNICMELIIQNIVYYIPQKRETCTIELYIGV